MKDSQNYNNRKACI